MPILLVLLLVLAIVALFGLFSIVGSVASLILTAIVAAVVGWLADVVVPGNVPYGFLGAMLSGLIGSWLGAALLGSIGPVLFGIPVISAFIGALIVTFVYSLLTHQMMGRRTL